MKNFVGERNFTSFKAADCAKNEDTSSSDESSSNSEDDEDAVKTKQQLTNGNLSVMKVSATIS